MTPTITFLRLGADAVAALPVAPMLGSCVVVNMATSRFPGLAADLVFFFRHQ